MGHCYVNKQLNKQRSTDLFKVPSIKLYLSGGEEPFCQILSINVTSIFYIICKCPLYCVQILKGTDGVPVQGDRSPPVYQPSVPSTPGKHVITEDAISVLKTLGSGEFGTVQQGVWTTDDGKRVRNTTRLFSCCWLLLKIELPYILVYKSIS